MTATVKPRVRLRWVYEHTAPQHHPDGVHVRKDATAAGCAGEGCQVYDGRVLLVPEPPQVEVKCITYITLDGGRVHTVVEFVDNSWVCSCGDSSEGWKRLCTDSSEGWK